MINIARRNLCIIKHTQLVSLVDAQFKIQKHRRIFLPLNVSQCQTMRSACGVNTANMIYAGTKMIWPFNGVLMPNIEITFWLTPPCCLFNMTTAVWFTPRGADIFSKMNKVDVSHYLHGRRGLPVAYQLQIRHKYWFIFKISARVQRDIILQCGITLENRADDTLRMSSTRANGPVVLSCSLLVILNLFLSSEGKLLIISLQL